MPRKLLWKLEEDLKSESNTTNIFCNGANTSYQDRNMRRPQLSIKTFTGKPTWWPTLVESFETGVDSNGALSNIHKFQHLKGYLSGQTERWIGFFLLTNDSYTESLNLLKEISEIHSLLTRTWARLWKQELLKKGTFPNCLIF